MTDDKRYTAAEGQIDVMVGITGDLRDLEEKVKELREHIERIMLRLRYPTIIDDAANTTLQKLAVVSVALSAALSVTTPLAETLVQAQKALQDSEWPHNASGGSTGPRVQGDS